VFFQSGEAALAPEALPAIAAGAQTLVKDNLSATVAGHTDGLEGDDRLLSQRRAEAVKRELVRLGVKADKLETSGQGLSEPMTPSAPGIAESFNRYVIIDFCGLDRFTK
jgi:OOP family OmpA-OmpF porin